MKGFLSFILILTLAVIVLQTSIFLNQNNSLFQDAKNELISTEIASTKRTIIENNIDKIIYTILKENVLKNNTNVLVVQKEINSKLYSYLKDKAFASNMFFENEKPLSITYLNQNSIVLLFQTQELTYGEYIFTSTPSKKTNVSAFFGKEIKLLFKIPQGYLIRVIN